MLLSYLCSLIVFIYENNSVLLPFSPASILNFFTLTICKLHTAIAPLSFSTSFIKDLWPFRPRTYQTYKNTLLNIQQIKKRGGSAGTKDTNRGAK